jgi:glycosyltransferase involved in cell wall biosynthesis
MDVQTLDPFQGGSFADLERFRLAIVIPAYRAADTIVDVIARCLSYADEIIVVDDACPQRSGDVARAAYLNDSRVKVVERSANGGVGAAMKTGIGVALASNVSAIVKIDADGQMDPSYVPTIKQRFIDDASLVCIKGNRFFNSQVLSIMPKTRLFGNAVLSLLVKGASGYWNAIDPTNGYLAFNAAVLRVLPWQSFDDSYFFEMSVLCELGTKRLPILELEMPTIYTAAPSSLSISKVAFEFPPKLLSYMFRRLLLQYFVFDVNLGTLYCVLGSILMLFGLVFGCYEWVNGIVTHTGKPTGTIMLAALPVMMGFQLLLNALMYDVQFSQKTHHEVLVDTHRRFLGGTELVNRNG